MATSLAEMVAMTEMEMQVNQNKDRQIKLLSEELKAALDRYDELNIEYQELQKKARKWRKAKKRWKRKYIALACRAEKNVQD